MENFCTLKKVFVQNRVNIKRTQTQLNFWHLLFISTGHVHTKQKSKYYNKQVITVSTVKFQYSGPHRSHYIVHLTLLVSLTEYYSLISRLHNRTLQHLCHNNILQNIIKQDWATGSINGGPTFRSKLKIFLWDSQWLAVKKICLYGCDKNEG